MRQVLRFCTGALRWFALVPLAFALLLHLASPDVLSLLFGGMLGGRRRAVFALYAIAAAAALLAFAGTPRAHRTRRRRVMLAAGLTAVPLALLHLARRPPWTASTVRYGSAEGVPIEATLYTPLGEGAKPAVVMVHGSAPIRRGLYEVWADPIARRGFVVLVPDKRGVGGSGGVFDRTDNTGAENIARLAADVRAGVTFLRGRPDVRPDAIGLVGVSQAGWVGPAAAADDPRVAFLAMITAPTVSTREEGRWSRLRGDDRGAATTALTEAERILDTLSSRGVDARPYLTRIRVPGLWLFGENDNSVPTRKSARVLDSLIAAGHPYAWRAYRGYGHLLIGRGGGEHVPRIAPASWNDLLDWLEGTAGAHATVRTR